MARRPYCAISVNRIQDVSDFVKQTAEVCYPQASKSGMCVIMKPSESSVRLHVHYRASDIICAEGHIIESVKNAYRVSLIVIPSEARDLCPIGQNDKTEISPARHASTAVVAGGHIRSK